MLVERDANACGELWLTSLKPTTIFRHWKLRSELAGVYGVEPYFLISRDHGTILPAGISDGTVVFFGGLHYSEYNDFIGPGGGEQDIFAYLEETSCNFRLLSWNRDPFEFLTPAQTLWDVPYNQYWHLPAPSVFSDICESLSRSRAKDVRYLRRRFSVETVESESGLPPESVLASFVEWTIESFEQRGMSTVFGNARHQLAMEILLGQLSAERQLRSVIVSYLEEPVGLGIYSVDSQNMRANYLFNLYRNEPNSVSTAVLLAIIDACSGTGLVIDGMRGAFTLKPRFGFQPKPSYALVRDPAWTVKPSTELSEECLADLYGRQFGALAAAIDAAGSVC